MTTVCSCSNRTCELFGCQRDARDRAAFAPFATVGLPSPLGPAPWPGQTVEARPLTDADVRRIVTDEIAKAFAIHLQGEAARRELDRQARSRDSLNTPQGQATPSTRSEE